VCVGGVWVGSTVACDTYDPDDALLLSGIGLVE
jgi:hypothetical protein